MKSLPVFEADSHRRARRRRQRYRLALVCLAVLVAGATGYALIHPAITMTGTAHTHDASCYTQVVSKTEQALSCTFAQAHAEDTARILHLHDQNCYDAAGMLVCPLEEAEAHTHTQACYETPEAHTHTEDCYERQQGELSCGEEETEAHLHTDDCYAWTDVPVCSLDEGAAAEPVLSCEKPELVPHAHTEDCYNEDGTLRCELPQILTHQHGEECFAAVTFPSDTQTLTCTNTDPEHIHDALCYGTWELTCGLTEGSAEPGDAEEPPAEPEAPEETEEPEEQEEQEEQEETEEDPEQPEEPAADTQDAADEADEAAVKTFRLGYYRICDGKPLLVKEETTERMTAAFNGSTRYYVTAADLRAVYGEFGFDSTSYTGELIFPHTDSRSSDKLWADCAPVYDEDSGEWQIPLSAQDKSDHSYVYYLPANTEGSASYFTDSKSLSDPTMLAENTFYTITVSAPEASGITQAGVYEVFTGESFEIKLPIVEGYVWKLTNLSTGMPLTPSSTEQQEQSVFYAFDAVTCPIRIAAVKNGSEDRLACTIRYTANTLSSSLVQLSPSVPVDKQYVITDGTVGGLPSLDEQVDLPLTDSYTLRTPDEETLKAGESDNTIQDKIFFYHFTGWRVKGSGVFFPAGTLVSVLDLAAQESNDVLELEAVWTPFDAREKISTVNFYVCLACEIMDSRESGVQGNPTENFTQSLFSAKVLGTDTNTKVQDLYAPVTSEGSTNAYAVDTELRALTQTPCDDGITLSAFPSDEEVFAVIREGGYSITIDGKQIPAQELTTEYFKVRWYVLKYHKSDGWHIDGVLVAKQAKLRVTKSFLGDAEAIEQIKSQTGDGAYRIKMNSVHPSGRQWVTGGTYYLTLDPANTVSDESNFGYESYDKDTDTYTWIVTGRIDGKYTFTEENYLPTSGSGAQCAAYCRVSDGEWLTGSAVSDVFMEAYPEDQPAGAYKTVSFRNYYLQPKTLTIHKIDAFTSLPLANVTFTLSRAGQTPLTLYRKPGTSMYSYMTSADYSEPVNDGRIVTDANGDLFLSLAAGSYALAETFPTGYSGAASIEFTVDENCQIISHTPDGTYITVANGGASMMIRNQSELLTSVKAVKDWDSTPEDRREQVVVKLLCNGAPLSGSEYTQTLNSGNDWTYEWHNLPLFTDGELAVYSLHEAMIGNTTYDKTADEDGYANYDVTYAPAQYSKGGVDCTANPYWTDENGVVQYADHVLLTVHNRLDGNSGQIRVTKQFQNAAGASIGQIEGTYTFGIYTAEYPDGARLATASIVYRNGTSDPADGIVRFDGLEIGSTYYVYELDSSGRPIAGGSTAVIGGKPFLVSGSGETVTVTMDAPTGAVTVTNCVAYPALPMTGGTGPEPFLLAGGLLSAGAAGALALRRRRKH